MMKGRFKKPRKRYQHHAEGSKQLQQQQQALQQQPLSLQQQQQQQQRWKKPKIPLAFIIMVGMATATTLWWPSLMLRYQQEAFMTIDNLHQLHPRFTATRSLASTSSNADDVLSEEMSTSSLSSSSLVPKFQTILHELEHSQLRFFMYNDTEMVQLDKLELIQRYAPQQHSTFLPKMSKHRAKLWQRYYSDAWYEVVVLDQLQRHPLRTFHPEQAQVFVIPIPMGAVLLGGHQKQSYQQAFSTLLSSPTFMERHGHDHVVLSHTGVAFNQETKRAMEVYGLSQWYPLLENVTIAQGYDIGGCRNLTHKLLHLQQEPPSPSSPPSAFHHYPRHVFDFMPLFARNQAAQTKFSFSIGIGATPDIPFQAASYQRFEQQQALFLFYRTGLRHFHYHSNRFRHLLMDLLPLQNNNNNNNETTVTIPSTTTTTTATTTTTTKVKNKKSITTSIKKRSLSSSSHHQSRVSSLLSSWLARHPSSIGYDLAADQWLHDLTSAKFCLVLRGDTPHSHALMRAIKVGCIPVIVSDYYEEYAPIFRSTLQLANVAIFITEQDFLTRPLECLERLGQWNVEDLQAKLQVLNMVQRIVLPDHPQSLFVPAFLKETYLAARSTPHELSTEESDDES